MSEGIERSSQWDHSSNPVEFDPPKAVQSDWTQFDPIQWVAQAQLNFHLIQHQLVQLMGWIKIWPEPIQR